MAPESLPADVLHVWPFPDGRQQRSTELNVELGSSESPALVRVTSWLRNPNTGRVVDRHGYIIRSERGVVLVDPTEPTPDVRPRFDAWVTGSTGSGAGAAARPIATVLTSGWHERDAYRVRERLGAPVWMPRGGVDEKEGEPDQLYDEGSALPGGLRAVTIDDRFAGDTVLCWRAPGGERVMFGGDAVMGGSLEPGHWRREPGMHLWMYGVLNEERFLSRFRRLVGEPVDLVCCGHGWPMPFRDDAAGTLKRLVEEGVYHRPGPLGNGRSLRLPPPE